MKYLHLMMGVGMALLLTSCATQMRKGPEPIVHKPRDVTLVYFDFDKSDLKMEEAEKLGETVRHLKGHPSWIAQLEGHADAIGSARYNVHLGDKRARAVKEMMVLEGVEPEQLVILSYGEEKPIASNQQDEGRARNRRVEVRVR